MKDRRSKLQIYYDICEAIKIEMQDNGTTSNTRIQSKCNTSYDKLLRYLDEMEKKGIVEKGKPITLTNKGNRFYQDYSKINELINEITDRLS
jgi:predicted transcriptional regulator